MKKTSTPKAKKAEPNKASQPEKVEAPKAEAQKVDKKQVIVGIIILIVALLLLFFSFRKNITDVTTKAVSKLPMVEKVDKTKVVPAKMVEQKVENVVFVFTSITENALHYKLYYATEKDTAFDEEHVVPLEGKAGKNTYSISLPVEKIAKFRLNFGTDIGKVTMSDIYLTGSQTKDLNNLFQYLFYQIVDLDNHGDGSFSFEMIDYNAYMEYRPQL